MKAKKLIEYLSEFPDYEVEVSVDVSMDEDDYDRRAIGDDVNEVMVSHSNKRLVILAIGELNY